MAVATKSKPVGACIASVFFFLFAVAFASSLFSDVKPAYAAPPAPEQWADKTYAEVGDEVSYWVRQLANDANWKYDELLFENPIPSGMAYKSKSLRVEDGHGQDVTDEAGSASLTDGVLTYKFKTAWLHANQDVTDKLSFYFVLTVKDEAAPSTQTNRARTTVNGGSARNTNATSVVVPVWYIDVNVAPSNASLLDNELRVIEGAQFRFIDELNHSYGNETTTKSGNVGHIHKRIVNSGTYYVKELLPSKGHLISNSTPKVVLNQNNAVSTNTGISKTVEFTNTTIDYAPAKTADKTYAEVGEIVSYDVTQVISTVKLSTLVFRDPLTAGMTYVPDSFHVTDSTGNDVTHLAGTVGYSGNVLTYTFKKVWLQENHGYEASAGKFRFRFQVEVGKAAAGKVFDNTAHLVIDGTDIASTTKSTRVPKWRIGITKTSSAATDTLHSVDGGQYEVYDANSVTYGVVKTSGGGKGYLDIYNSGTYLVREMVPPKGHEISEAVRTIKLTADKRLADNAAATAVSDTAAFANTSVKYAPTKSVSSTFADAGSILTYTISQQIPSNGVSSVRFRDEIPAGTEYIKESFEVIDGDGDDVTLIAGRLSVSNRTITFDFDSDYLKTPSGHNGNPYIFRFNVKILDSAAGSTLTNIGHVIIDNQDFPTTPVNTRVPVWYVKAFKHSDYPDLLNGNSLYSLKDAIFEIRDLSGALYGTLKSGADGITNTITMLRSGTYRIYEVTPPLGHKHAVIPYQEFTLARSNDGETLTIEFTNEGIVSYIDYIAVKVDTDYYFGSIMGEDATHLHDTNWWQGNANDFSSTRVRVDFYGSNRYTGTPLASAVFKADAKGRIAFAQATPVEGTWRYTRNGYNVMPLGYVQITETVAPDGYNADTTKHRYRIVQKDDATRDFVLDAVTNAPVGSDANRQIYDLMKEYPALFDLANEIHKPEHMAARDMAQSNFNEGVAQIMAANAYTLDHEFPEYSLVPVSNCKFVDVNDMDL